MSYSLALEANWFFSSNKIHYDYFGEYNYICIKFLYNKNLATLSFEITKIIVWLYQT